MGYGNGSSESICDILSTLPINYPVDNVILQGQDEAVSNFISFNSDSGVATFRNGDSTKVFDCSKITGLDF